MANAEPVLIEAVINGQATKAWNPNVPRSVAEVRDEIHAVLDAGASMVHNHPGDGATGHNGYDFYVAAWTPVLEARPGAIVYPTLGGGGAYHDRFGHVPALAEAGLLHVAQSTPAPSISARSGLTDCPSPTTSSTPTRSATSTTRCKSAVSTSSPPPSPSSIRPSCAA